MLRVVVRAAVLTTVLPGVGLLLSHGCLLGGLVEDCFGSNTISQRQYEDLNPIERLFYEENSCGRYTRRSNLFSDLFD